MRPCSAARRCTPTMSAASPNRCTGMMAFVRELTRRAASPTSRLKVNGSMSQKTVFAPAYSTALAVDSHVKAGTITSSPGPTPAASAAKCSAAVQELTAVENWAPTRSEKRPSNSATFGPCPTHALRRVSSTAASSAASNQGLDSGTFMARPPGDRAVRAPEPRPQRSSPGHPR